MKGYPTDVCNIAFFGQRLAYLSTFAFSRRSKCPLFVKPKSPQLHVKRFPL